MRVRGRATERALRVEKATSEAMSVMADVSGALARVAWRLAEARGQGWAEEEGEWV